MEELRAYRQRMLRHWEAIPDILKEAVAGIRGEDWHRPPAGGRLTLHQTLSHLRDIEKVVVAPAIRRLLDGERELPLPYPAWEAWLAAYDPQEVPAHILEEYLSLLAREIGWVRACVTPPWNAAGRHPQYGRRTLQWWVERSLAQARVHARRLGGMGNAEC